MVIGDNDITLFLKVCFNFWLIYVVFVCVSGESGLGKSTLINSLFLTDLYAGRNFSSAKGDLFYCNKIGLYFTESTILLSLIMVSIIKVCNYFKICSQHIFIWKNYKAQNHKNLWKLYKSNAQSIYYNLKLFENLFVKKIIQKLFKV